MKLAIQHQQTGNSIEHYSNVQGKGFALYNIEPLQPTMFVLKG